jgi:hypothetical protein
MTMKFSPETKQFALHILQLSKDEQIAFLDEVSCVVKEKIGHVVTDSYISRLAKIAEIDNLIKYVEKNL